MATRVLITWGSKRGGTEGLAGMIAEMLRGLGCEVVAMPARDALHATGFDAAIIGGALYAGRWHADAARFVRRRARTLERVPVWFFSSGPLDTSADSGAIPPTRQVERLMSRVGAQGHMTFGGRLAPDAKGFPAAAMAKKHPGDWRNGDHVRRWASSVAEALPNARPRPVIVLPGSSFDRLALHASVGWMVCALLMALLTSTVSHGAALAIHAVAAPIAFAVIAAHYFKPMGARDPLPTALAFTSIVALLDAIIVAGLVLRSWSMFTSIAGFWLPLALIFLVTWMVGTVKLMTPPAKAGQPKPAS